MKAIKIVGYPNLYYMEDDFIQKYLTDGTLDLKESKPKNKIKSFTLLVRKDKKINGKVKIKKKLFKFEDITILAALKELKDEPEKLSEALEAGTKIDAASLIPQTLDAVWDAFYNHKIEGTDAELGTWKTTTAGSYKSYYSTWIKKPLGHRRIETITKDEIQAIINKVKATRSLRTATTTIEVLKPLFDWHFEKYDIPLKNPVPKKKKKIYDLQNERVVDVDVATAKSLWEAMESYDVQPYRDIFMWIRTGRRRGEVMGLKIEDIDTVDKSFTVFGTSNKAGVDMTYKLREELEATLPSKSEGRLFTVHPDSITKHWNKIKEQIDSTFKLNGRRVPITDLHLHDIRHIISGVLKSEKVSKETRAKVLGHKDNSITNRYGVDYYADIDEAYEIFLQVIS